MTSELFTFVEGILKQALGSQPQTQHIEVVGGGCINHAYKVITSEGTYFLKWNEDGDDFFQNEEQGLQLLREAEAIRIPKVISRGAYDSRSYLVLEYIQPGHPQPTFWEDFGERLAALHQRLSPNGQYGLGYDNEIGRLPQKNTWNADWATFFIENRLEVQATLAYYNNLVDKRFLERFRSTYDQLLGALVDCPASLLHGDLWGGNFVVGDDGRAVLIDPAVYYGNREIEISFTRLFGGFDREFYRRYNEVLPLDPGFDERSDIYNLYPLLVHVNLFGQSYLSGVEQTIRRYL